MATHILHIELVHTVMLYVGTALESKVCIYDVTSFPVYIAGYRENYTMMVYFAVHACRSIGTAYIPCTECKKESFMPVAV